MPHHPSVSPSSDRIETKTHTIHVTPRISATKLAEYVIADPSRQETIAKNAKRAPKSITIPYTSVRTGFSGSMRDGSPCANVLRQLAQDIEAEVGGSDWRMADRQRSTDALVRLADLVPSLEIGGATKIHRPERGWGHLLINGVRVSVQPDLAFSVLQRGVSKIGAVILNTGQGEELSLARNNARYSVGDCLTALLYRLVEHRLSNYGRPLHTKCCAIDIFRSEIHIAPTSHKTLLKHMESACKVIALRWESLPGLEPGDEIESGNGLAL